MSASDYRPDIDGLRAVAVLPVVLYHAGLGVTPGGYVGVDVFFVISGFLITAILRREMAEGRFSLVRFWERRVRRILPPLLLVMLAAFAAAHFVLAVPLYYENFAESVMAQGGFLSNVYFMRQDGYFAAPSDTKPLLHFWSLAVEEQFYILFPVFLLALAGLRGGLSRVAPVALGGVAVLSFALCVWMVNITPRAAFTVPGLPDVWGHATNAGAGFFLLPTRAWELAAGALLALVPVTPKTPRAGALLSLGGLTAILAAVFFYGEGTAFPGVAAVLPVLGTVAVIAGNTSHATPVARVLSWRPLVGLGLISYGLYLWHWPLFVLARPLWPDAPGVAGMLGLILLSVGLAWLSYRYVETPIRRKRVLPTPRAVFAGAFAGLFVLVGFGTAIYRAEGLPGRLAPEARAFAAAMEDKAETHEPCHKNRSLAVFKEKGPCLIGATEAPGAPDFMLWGDSHAAALEPAVSAMAAQHGRKGVMFAVPNCTPVIKVYYAGQPSKCVDIKILAKNYQISRNIENIIIISRWSKYISSNISNGFGPLLRSNESDESATSNAARAILRRNLDKTIATLNPKQRDIWLIQQVPFFFKSLDNRNDFDNLVKWRHLAAWVPWLDMPEAPPRVPLADHRAWQAPADRILDAVADRHGLGVIDPASALCDAPSAPDPACHLKRDGVVFYRDDNHLSATGARHIAEIFRPVFADANRETAGR